MFKNSFSLHFIPICSQHSELSCTQTNKWINKQLQLHYPLTLLGIISFNKQSDCHIMTVNMNQPRSSWILMTKYRLESRTCSIAAHGYPSSGHCANSSPATHHAQQLTHQTVHSMWTQQSNNSHHCPSFRHNSSCRLTTMYHPHKFILIFRNVNKWYSSTVLSETVTIDTFWQYQDLECDLRVEITGLKTTSHTFHRLQTQFACKQKDIKRSTASARIALHTQHICLLNDVAQEQ